MHAKECVVLSNISKNKHFWLSGIFHIALILLIGLSSTNIPIQKVPSKKPIKSYLYRKPEVSPELTITETVPPIKTELEEQPIEPETTTTPENKTTNKPERTENKNTPEQALVPEKINTPKRVLSAQEHLEQLKQSVTSAPQYQPQYRYNNRQPSIFNQNLPAVPKYTKPKDADAIKKANTQNLTGDLSITKNDNGTCTITEDLTSIGMEGIKATQYFLCGESKQDKNFREHMAKYKKGRPIN